MGATVTPLPSAVKSDSVHHLFVQDRRELNALLAFLRKLRDDIHFVDRLTGCVEDHVVDGLDRAIQALKVLTDDRLQSDPQGYVATLVKLYHALANVVDTAHTADGTEPERFASKTAAVPSGRLMLTLRLQYEREVAAAVTGTTDAGHAALAATYRND